MSDAKPATGYTITEQREYLCDFCPQSSPDLDAARAHKAVHVAGPELLAAVKDLRKRMVYNAEVSEQKWDECNPHVASALAKAEPTKGASTP